MSALFTENLVARSRLAEASSNRVFNTSISVCDRCSIRLGADFEVLSTKPIHRDTVRFFRQSKGQREVIGKRETSHSSSVIAGVDRGLVLARQGVTFTLSRFLVDP